MNERCLVQLETGSGKTALCFTIACYYASRGFKVFIVNESDELTFRDFKKVENGAKNLDFPVALYQTISMNENFAPGLFYMPFKVFHEVVLQNEQLCFD